MSARKARKFEFKLGKFGFILFSFGIATLVFLSFIGGVIVGKHIESYPEKIARTFPGAIKDTISDATDSVMDKGSKAAEALEHGKDRIKLSFYDTLPGKNGDRVETFEKRVETPATAPPVIRETAPPPPGEKAAAGKDTYCIQVASFKDKKNMQTLQAELQKMGQRPKVETADLGAQGIWYRVTLAGFATEDDARRTASLIERELPRIKCQIVRNKS